MNGDPPITDIAHVISLAVAPVFLLSAVGVTLTVLTNRLARIIDRARDLESRFPDAGLPDAMPAHAELATLSRRAHLVQRAITLCTACALLICLVIVALFVGAFRAADLSALIVLLFVGAMLAFSVAFLYFLREIFLGTSSLRFGQRGAPGGGRSR